MRKHEVVLLATLAAALGVLQVTVGESACPDFVGQAETFLGSLRNVQRPGEPDSLLKVFPEQHPWSCCQLCKEQDYCEYFTWQSTGVDVQEVPIGDCMAFNESTCADSGAGFLPWDAEKHGAYSGSLSQCERPEERFLRKALLAKHEALALHESSRVAEAAVRVARLAHAEAVSGAAAEELVAGALARLEADPPARRMAIDDASVSDVDSASYGPCPPLSSGVWEIGKLRSVTDSGGLPTQLEAAFEDLTPRECCGSCKRFPGCQFWTWVQPQMHSETGQCNLFSDTACQTGSDGLLPFEIGDKLARTGTDICTATIDKTTASYEDQKVAAIGEVHAALSASVAVKKKQLAKLEAEEKAADEARAAAEKTAEEDAKVVAEAKAKEEAAAAALEAAKQAEKEAAAVLAAARKAKAAAESKADEQEAIAKKAKREEKKVKKELRAAKVAKASAENIKASDFMIQDRATQESNKAHPYQRCPVFSGSEFHVGSFREVVTGGTSSLLKAGSNGVGPLDCCKECTSTEGCKYWSWAAATHGATEGDCTMFTEAECAPIQDTSVDSAELPFKPFDKLGRVGTASCS